MENSYSLGHNIYKFSQNLFFEEENILDYRPGGYHPVILGDTLKDGRYKICHKLGFGGFSTVWVAKDNKLEQWVSIKIIKADKTNQYRELLNLRALTEYSKGNLNSQHLIQFLDDFLHEGPNGCHQCLTFELLGPTIDNLQEIYFLDKKRSDWEYIFNASTQLLQALDFMHNAGYAHGDVSFRNLVFDIGRLSHLSEKRLFKMLGLPISAEVVRLDGKTLEKGVPSQMIESANWNGWLITTEIEENNEDGIIDGIRLIDFGESFFQNAVPESLAQPPDLRPPETLFNDKFDYKVDLWAAGLLIYYLMFGSYPGLYGLTPEKLIESQIDFIGELPLEWQQKWEQMKLNNKEFKERELESVSLLERHFNEHVPEPELKILFSVIKGLTSFLPSDRISASQALNLIKNAREENEKRLQRGESYPCFLGRGD